MDSQSTANQIELLAKSFGCARFVWNNTLKYRSDAYKDKENGEFISHSQAEKRLVPLKIEFPWLSDVSSVIFQQSLRDQQIAFDKFWKKQAKYPRFKSKHGRQSIRLTKAGFRIKNYQVFIAKSKEPLAIRWSRELSSEPNSITISKDPANRYFISFSCDFESKPMPVATSTIGIDLGLKDLFITSNGEKYANPKHIKRHEQKLAFLHRKLSKRKKAAGTAIRPD